jgi:hypothetical protein
MAKHFELNEEQFDNVAWELTAKAINAVNLRRMFLVVKFPSNEWAIWKCQTQER